MGQKVNPISNRLGIVRGWDSNWYGGKDFGESILEDSKIRKYLDARLGDASISRIVIERTLKMVTITVCTARPGLIIGKGGEKVDTLKEELKKLTQKDVQINIFEVKKPELDAVIVANNIARQVEGKIAYRRAIKMAIQNTMRAGAEGIKVLISGRLNGAEIARSEMFKEGRTPLHTLRADIDYCKSEALTKVGLLSRCGFAVVKSMARRTWLLTSLSRRTMDAISAVVTERTSVVRRTIIAKFRLSCYNPKEPNIEDRKKVVARAMPCVAISWHSVPSVSSLLRHIGLPLARLRLPVLL